MYTLLIASALALTAPQQPPAQPQDGGRDRAATADKSLDGTWAIVCLEKNGQPMPEAKNMTVKCDGNTITCSAKDGKPAMTLKVKFGKNGTVRVSEESASASPEARPGKPADTAGRDGNGEKSGVYVLTGDYLALCLHNDDRGASERGNTTEVSTTGGSPSSKTYCSIILKREGSSSNK